MQPHLPPPVHNWKLRRARQIIAAGGIVACPTEGVYGLSCDPASLRAVARLLSIKARDIGKGFILIASETAQLLPYLKLPDGRLPPRIRNSWPGPVTWLLPAADWVPSFLRGHHDTLAVRVTAAPVARALCRECGHPLVSTSANRAGQRPAHSALEVLTRFDDEVDMILHATVRRHGRPSEIRSAATGLVIRQG